MSSGPGSSGAGVRLDGSASVHAAGLPGLSVFRRCDASAADFVRFWAGCYEYPDEAAYTRNIGQPSTRERLRELFRWKIGPRFFEKHWPEVEKRFVSRLGEALALAKETSAERWLEVFPEGGAIYRIYWMHCLYPDRFPIFDMHVHRAMNMIEGNPHRELAKHTYSQQVAQYVTRYLPFWGDRFSGTDPRALDRALWAFGKFMREKSKTSFASGLGL